MSPVNYRTLNLALPSGGNLPGSGKPQDAVPSGSPSSSPSPSRQRALTANGARAALLVKPLYAQNQSTISNALVLTGHQPPSALSVSHAVVIYGQNVNSSKVSMASAGDHFRPRTGTTHGGGVSPCSSLALTFANPLARSQLSPSQSLTHPSTFRHSISALTSSTALSAPAAAAAAPRPTTAVAAALPTSFLDDELLILKEQVLKLQRALESLCSGSPSAGLVGSSSTSSSTSSSASSSSSSIGNVSSNSLVSLSGITFGSGGSSNSNSINSSRGSNSSSSGGGSNRTSRSGEGILTAPWAISAGSLEAMLQQAFAPLAAAAAPGAAPQMLFASAHEAAMTAARAKLLDLFVRKANQLLLESAPDLLMPPTMVAPLGEATPVAAGAGASNTGPSNTGTNNTGTIRGRPPLAPGGTGETAASASSGSGGGASSSTQSNLNSRIQSAPAVRGRISGSNMGTLPMTSAGGPGGGAAVSESALSPPSSAVYDLSPAGVLVAASRRLSELQAVFSVRGSGGINGIAGGRGKVAEQQLADTQAKLDSTMADNTLLRNMISELQSNSARPSSRAGVPRPESAAPPQTAAATSPSPPSDPLLVCHISSLTSDLGAVRGRLDATQRRLEASEAAVTELRRQLQESQAASRKPATSGKACQTQQSAGAREKETQSQSEVAARVAELEAQVVEATRTQLADAERLAEAEAEIRRLQDAAAAEEGIRQELEAQRRLVSELQLQLGRSSVQATEAAAHLAESRARVAELEALLRQRSTAAAEAEASALRELQMRLDEAAAREGLARREAEEAEAGRRQAEGEAEALRRRLTAAEAALCEARRESVAAADKSDRKSAELAARISTLDSEVKRLMEELRTAKGELEAAQELVARRERDAAVLRDEKHEAFSRLSSAHHELDAERKRLAEELAAAQRLRSQLLDEAQTVKALGTLVQAKTLRLDFGAGQSALSAGPGGVTGGGMGGGVRPGTGDPAASARLTNLVKEQQAQLSDLADKLSSREDRCARLQVVLTQAQDTIAMREKEAAEAARAAAERGGALLEAQSALGVAQEEISKLRLQLDDLSRHGDSVKAHNTDLHKMAEKLQREGAAAAGEARELRAQLEVTNQSLSDERAHRQRLLNEVLTLSEARDSAASDAATLKLQRRAEGSRLEELQAALLLATQKLAGAERTINAQDERIALLLARSRAAEERLAALGVSPPPSPSPGSPPSSQPLPPDDASSGDPSATATELLLQRAGLTVPMLNPAATTGGGSGGNFQPPVGSLSLAPLETVSAQQRLSQLLAGGAPALGSMVQDMINKVLAESVAGGGTAGARVARASARTSTATGGGGGGGGIRTPFGGGPPQVPTAASASLSPGQVAGAHQQNHFLMRPSSASVVGRVMELPPGSNGPGAFGRAGAGQAYPYPSYPNTQSTSPQNTSGSSSSSSSSNNNWTYGLPAGAGGVMRPQSAWTHRGGGGGSGMNAPTGGGGVLATTPSIIRRAGSGHASHIGAAGLQSFAEPESVGIAAGGGSSTGMAPTRQTPPPVRSTSPTWMLSPGGSSRRVSSGGSGGVGASGGGLRGSSSVRPTTALSKKTVLLLSMNSAGGPQLDEMLAVDDDWQPV